MDFTTITKPKAKKPYQCFWCGERIEAGEVHAKWAGTFEGDFHSDRFHEECNKACDDGAKQRDADGEWELLPHEHKRGSTEYR